MKVVEQITVLSGVSSRQMKSIEYVSGGNSHIHIHTDLETDPVDESVT
ncbi:MAG: hypothetical protein U9R01_00100 [candidate division WOR-3 bacterium]|nr:hypothetical protein [candidate division WOR-3 bacterium]